jgi:hypothetical protein
MSGEADPTALALYKMAVEMADRVSVRRATANTYFLTVHTTLATVVAVFIASPDRAAEADAVPMVLIAVVGVLLSVVWWVLLRSYRDLNAAKFEVILEMEKSLPSQPYGDEWASLKKDPVAKWRGRYAELGTIERVVPAAFAVVYVGLAWAALT